MVFGCFGCLGKAKTVEDSGKVSTALAQNFQAFSPGGPRWKSKNKFSMVLLGLDDAGKTSLLHSLEQQAGGTKANLDQGLCAPAPTLKPQCKCVKVAGLTFTLHDTPGRKSFRDAWHESISTCAAEAIVFVVDSTDSMRLPIVQEEFWRIRKAFVKLPILLLATKQDISEAVTSDEISNKLMLSPNAELESNDIDSGIHSIAREHTCVDQCSALDPTSISDALVKFVTQ